MDEQDRPVHVEINCTTGAVTHTPVTDMEWQEMQDAEQQALDDHAERQQQDQELRAAVQGHSDPVVQALAKRLGLS